MGVAPAGIERLNTGHHHLLIDTKLPSLDDPIPNDFNHLHFGGGQTEATVELPLAGIRFNSCWETKIMSRTTLPSCRSRFGFT